MFGFKQYNHKSFQREMAMKHMMKAGAGVAAGPRPGSKAPDFEGRSLEGEKIRLSEFAGRQNVVLTFGSATCPFTAGSIGGLNELYEDYDREDVQFLFVYVREAHPGESLPAHRSMDEKRLAAEQFRDEEDIEMPVIVDDLGGKIHRKYGSLPNATYVIDKAGRVVFRSLWSRSSAISQALDELFRRQEAGREDSVVLGEDKAVPMTYAMLHSHRALERGGDQALREFREQMGMPGRAAVAVSRVLEPVSLHPGRAMGGAALAGAVIAGSLLVGYKLRQKRYGPLRNPYDYTRGRRRREKTDEDYAVGI